MPTWKDFVDQANHDLEKGKTLLSTSNTIVLQEALEVLSKSMQKVLGKDGPEVAFEALDRTRAENARCDARVYVEVFPVVKDAATTPFEHYMTTTKEENTAFLTLSIAPPRRCVHCDFRAGQDRWRFANMDIRESILETHTYYVRLWHQQIAVAAEALKAELGHLGEERVRNLLWEAHVVQKYAAAPAQKEALYNLAANVGEEGQVSIPVLDILDTMTLDQLKTCNRGKNPPADGWNTTNIHAQLLGRDCEVSAYSLMRPPFNLCPQEDLSAAVSEWGKHAEPYARQVKDAAHKLAVFLKTEVAAKDLTPTLTDAFIGIYDTINPSHYAVVVGTRDILDTICPGERARILDDARCSSLETPLGGDFSTIIRDFSQGHAEHGCVIGPFIKMPGLAGPMLLYSRNRRCLQWTHGMTL